MLKPLAGFHIYSSISLIVLGRLFYRKRMKHSDYALQARGWFEIAWRWLHHATILPDFQIMPARPVTSGIFLHRPA